MWYVNNVGVVILAAGRGTRLNCTDKPKVMCEIGGKPIVSYAVETLKTMGFSKDQICLVVGFRKDTVKEYFGGTVTYADQDEQLGTAHAAWVGMQKIKRLEDYKIEQILVMGGDDSAFYTADSLAKFVHAHRDARATVSVLTVEVDDPSGLARIIRDSEGNITAILEKEQISEEQKSICEVNTGTYCIDRAWFEAVYPRMPKVDGLNEYGLNMIIGMAKSEGMQMQAVKLENHDEWFGINTLEELNKADNRKIHNS